MYQVSPPKKYKGTYSTNNIYSVDFQRDACLQQCYIKQKMVFYFFNFNQCFKSICLFRLLQNLTSFRNAHIIVIDINMRAIISNFTHQTLIESISSHELTSVCGHVHVTLVTYNVGHIE